MRVGEGRDTCHQLKPWSLCLSFSCKYVVRIIQILFHSALISTNPHVTGGHNISRAVTNLYCTFSMYFTLWQFWRSGSYLFIQFDQTRCFLLLSAFFYFCCLLGMFFFLLHMLLHFNFMFLHDLSQFLLLLLTYPQFCTDFLFL